MKYLLTFFFLLSTLRAEKVANVFLVGAGKVGAELLAQIERYQHPDLKIRVVGIANIDCMLIDPAGIDLKEWKSRLVLPMNYSAFAKQMFDLKLPMSVFVDCTSDEQIANSYAHILKRKIPVVTPSKKGNSGLYKNYVQVRKIAKKYQTPFFYDASVGAGLPLVSTIKSMRRGGDEVVKMEAILSGTLSYLFNTYDGGIPFSKILQETQSKRYTEPDPRDDLNGTDMARKFLILAREAGMSLEMKDIVIERFLPDECFLAPTMEEFYKCVARCDNELARKAENAKRKGQVLRFMGTLEGGKVLLALKAVDSTHPFYHLSDTDNMVAIHSRIYYNNPIVIKGPGSGPAITAASLLSSIVFASGID